MESRYVVMRFEESQIAPLLSALTDRTGRSPKIYANKAKSPTARAAALPRRDGH
jgi:hypothetical protein